MAQETRIFVLLLLAGCSHRVATSAPTGPRPPYTVLTAEDIRRSPGQSLEQLLLAHVPGLSLERAADGRPVLHLRGPNSLMSEDEPLFVLNGVALGPAVTSNLTVVDIHEIETVQVLREAVATAAYGVRGASGVIIIRTKQN
ncbi:MAG TPA: TonB-dependent receptor plug domain-containing protein [Gemmatimonadales bacterium]|nr:TonB-dependent receptor plug domain-containing protein [Gemmatimonadales bacterium]